MIPNSSAPRWTEHTVSAEEAGRTVQEIVTGSLGISRRMIQKLTRGKGIRLNRRPAFLARKVRAGDVIDVRIAEEEAGLEPVAMELAIVHEDEAVLVVNKPPFLLVHPTAPRHTTTLAHGIAFHYREQDLRARVRPVHRLDRDTSGLLLIAKSAPAQHQLDQQLREREMGRSYLAFASGVVEPDTGEIDAPIGRHAQNPGLRAVRHSGGQPALTRFRVVERFGGATLVEAELETGRTHQIRVHLAHLGHPLLGDRAYEGAAAPPLRRPALHAAGLSFTHPFTGESMHFEASLPDDLARLRQILREERSS